LGVSGSLKVKVLTSLPGFRRPHVLAWTIFNPFILYFAESQNALFHCFLGNSGQEGMRGEKVETETGRSSSGEKTEERMMW